MTASSDRDHAVADVAARQYGVIAYPQLRACGLDRQAIAWRVKSRRLIEVHPHVYAVGHAELRREGRWLAAVLHGGSEAVLSHGDAGALWGLMPVEGSWIDVSTPRRSGREPVRPVRLHRIGTLRADETTEKDGIPVTTVARTTSAAAPSWRRSELCDRCNAPAPRTNVMVAGFMVDFFWPDLKLIAEVDGFTYHAMPKAFAADRERDQLLMLAGFRVIRFTYNQLTRRDERRRSAARLTALIRQSGSL